MKNAMYPSRWMKRNYFPYVLIVPSVAFMSLVLLYPISRSIVLSFYKVNLLTYGQEAKFIGFWNYAKVFRNPYFWNSVKITLIFTGGSVLGTYLLGLGTALLLNVPFKGRAVARGAFLIPWVIPEVVLALIFLWIYDPQFGVLNFFLQRLGLINENLYLLGKRVTTLPSLILILVWHQYPIALLILLGGLQTIPKEQYEVASIDGANSLQRFRCITLPGLRYVSGILIMLITVWSFVHFTLVYVMTQGGPARASETLVIRAYVEAFRYHNMGRACTLSAVTLIISLIFVLFYFTFIVRRQEE